MMFAWVKINHISYICQILDYNCNERKCTISVGDIIFYDVPWNDLTNIKDEKLPWE